MQGVTVIAPLGATIHPPATLRLSKEQYAPRAGQLGPRHKNGVCDVLAPVAFKRGERLGVARPGARLSKALFEIEKPKRRAAPKARAAEAPAEDPAALDL